MSTQEPERITPQPETTETAGSTAADKTEQDHSAQSQTQETQGEQQQQQSQQESNDQQSSDQPSQVQPPRKSRYLKCNYKFCKNYEDQSQIAKSFPQLVALQTPPEIEGIQNALCYVIRSNNEDDVHKAIKYGIWTSVPGNNVKLNQAYEQSVALNVDVYLFFSVVKSRQFIGVAKLKSSFQEETFSYWWQPHKFKGHFKIEWVFVKDVKQKAFEGLKNSQNDEISRSKDCTELNFEETGKKMLQIYKDASAKPNIFQGFQYLDQKEQFLRNAYSNLGRQGNKNQNNNGNMNQRMNAPQQQQLGNMMYPNYFLNPQMFSQMGQTGMFQQYTPEQINQISQMCYTNIYPPNTYPTNNYYNGQHGNNNHHNKTYNNGNGNNQNNNPNAHNRRNQKKHNNNAKNQNDAPSQQQQQQTKLSEQDPCLPTAAEQTA